MLEIEINKNLDEYSSGVVMGLTIPEVVTFGVSMAISTGMVVLLKDKIGTQASAYLCVPIIAPIGLNCFYHPYGMKFKDYVSKIWRLMFQKPFIYMSEEDIELLEVRKKQEKEKMKKDKKTKKPKKSFFESGFKQLKDADEPLYASPQSVQQLIEIKSIAKSGIFEVANGKYSKTYLFSDINYVTHTTDGQKDIFARWCGILNSFDVPFKTTISNKNKDMERTKEELLFKMQGDGFDEYREGYNAIMCQKIEEGKQGIDQERYLTITVERNNFEEAKAYFLTLEMNLKQYFMDELGSVLIPLDAEKRLQILHDFYRMGEEGEYTFNFEECMRNNIDFRNDICNATMKIASDYIEDERKFIRALYIQKWPSSHSDEFLNELVSVPIHSVVSIDSVPIPKDLVNTELKNKYLGVEDTIRKQQKKRNQNNDFSSDISYTTRRDKEDLEILMDDIRDNDQSMFWSSVTILLTADSKEELDKSTITMKNIAKRRGFRMETYFYQQREALNTALPIGVRQVKTMRTLVTRALGALMPFNVQELYIPSGIYYGINQLSHNILVGNRKKLLNGNGFVFGIPGAGKSFFVKLEMGGVYLNTKDDIIVIDPQNEYFDIANRYGGAIVNLTADTDTFINPFDYAEASSVEEVIVEKTEAMQGIAEECSNGELNGKQKSIIDRCVRNLFREISKEDWGKKIPTMKDFYTILNEQEEEAAKEIALVLERFIEGSLNIFSHHTNVDVDNRLIVYGLNDLGEELSAVAILVMMANISARIEKNATLGKATWLYIDELHVLLDKKLAAKFLESLWKRVRKLAGICTGITQNVIDILRNPISATMVNNSEFTAIMKQSPKDKEKILESIAISEAQLRFATQAQSGTGLLRHGDVILPMDARIEKDSMLYQLFNTNLHEKAKMLQEER